MKPLRTRLQLARERLGLPWEVLERDYVLSWVLAGISRVESTFTRRRSRMGSRGCSPVPARGDGSSPALARGRQSRVGRRATKLSPADRYGVKVALSASDRLNPAPPAAGSRYQNWKFQVVPGSRAPGSTESGETVPPERQDTQKTRCSDGLAPIRIL